MCQSTPQSGDADGTRSAEKMRPLTAEERMLVMLRDTLYEGVWEELARDLRDRAQGRPNVFDIVPNDGNLKETIEHHLQRINVLSAWEREHRVRLRAEQNP